MVQATPSRAFLETTHRSLPDTPRVSICVLTWRPGFRLCDCYCYYQSPFKKMGEAARDGRPPRAPRRLSYFIRQRFKRLWKAPGNLTQLPETRVTSRHSAASPEAS